jgi:hypothetical protein
VAAETISIDLPAGGMAARYALALLGLADDARGSDAGAVDRIAADLERLAACAGTMPASAPSSRIRACRPFSSRPPPSR